MKKAKLFMMLALLVMGVSNLFAQNVTVRPDNGSTLPAVKKNGKSDTFFDWGGFATWKHEQLTLTMTTGDSDNNTNGADSNGQLAYPANDIFATSNTGANATNYLQIGAGNGMSTYLVFSLPKGYRFTGYTITFQRINQVNGMPNNELDNNSQNSITFGETGSDFGTYVSGLSKTLAYNSNAANYSPETITRTSQTATDMSNILYFKLGKNNNDGRAFIQLNYVELYFTAENNYAPILPTPNVTGQTAVDIPFTTNKMDYGVLEKHNVSGDVTNNGRISYVGSLDDLNANLILYEDNSTESITAAQNSYDGTPGLRVKYESGGSITSSGNYFELDASKHKNKSQVNGKYAGIYYIESPIWATNSSEANGHKEPIGYRIVGASFDLKGADEQTPATFRIQHTGSDGVTYGLNDYQGTYIRYSLTLDYQRVWTMDEDGYIYFGTGSSKTYLTRMRNSDYFQVTTTKPNANRGTFEIVDNDGVKQIKFKNSNEYIGFYEYETYSGTQSYAYVTTGEDRAFYTLVSPATYDESFESYTFQIYDKTGTRVEKEIDVTGPSQTLSIDGLNNDAVKIRVIGKGYVSGRLTMQALDPYIDRLDIVCQQDDGNGGKLTQQFNATDFSVKGGAFTFYVPEDFKGNAKFTFENLYSHYGDNTYYNANNSPELHARYFFVGSEYGDYDNSDVYARYNNTTHRDADYTKKIDCLEPGNTAYTFNNAGTVTTGNGGQYMEYPFSKALYEAAGGDFEPFIFPATLMGTGTTKTAYLFTCDEPRYNIAPTTATQHVYYAYYEMTIDMQKKDYRPIFAWDKIYDETFYAADNSDIKRDPQWGLKITTEQVTDDQGKHSGYLTVSKILDVIKNGLEATAAQGRPGQTGYVPAQPAVQGLDATGEKAPKNMNQILYIDASDLMSIMANQTVRLDEHGDTVKVDGKPQYDSHPVSELLKKLGTVINGDTITNALIYLPYGSKSSDDNFAYNTIAKYNVIDEDGDVIEEVAPSFRGASNIVITDRYPFYAPYDIQVDAAKMAKYERTLTNQALYGDDDQHLTIVLPFEINVDGEGIHTNNDSEGSAFMLSTMKPSNALSKNDGSQIDFYANGYFDKITEKSEPNKPYVVTMQGGTESSFKVHVNGSLVKATPSTPSITGILTGESATGDYTYKENNVEKTAHYSFTHEGTYTGLEIGDEKNGGAAKATTTVFYFANNFFLDSKTLAGGKSLKMLPFRSYYDYTVSGATAKVSRFRIVLGENPNMGGTNGITDVQRDADLAVIPGSRCITLMARADKDVTIHAVNGQTIDKCNLRAGETRTVSVPAGVYVINGVKMVVK